LIHAKAMTPAARIAAAIEQVLSGAIPEIAGVFHVEWDRIGTTQFVTEIFVHQRHF